MRILLAVHHFPPLYTGGAEWRTYRTARALMARGHTVRVVCVERIDHGLGEVSWQDDVYDGVEVRRLAFNLAAAPDPFRWGYDNIWIGAHVGKMMAEFQPHLLHLISGYLISGRVLLEAAQRGVPAVVTLTDFWFLCPRIAMQRSDGSLSTMPIRPETCAQCLGEEQRRFRWFGRALPCLSHIYWANQREAVGRVEARASFLRATLDTAAAIISPSQFLRELHVQAGVSPERIIYSRQGRDLAGLKATSAAKQACQTLRIGYLGQIARLKGVHVLLEAAQRLPDAPLTIRIYGDLERDPRYAARLRRLAASDPRVTLVGPYRGEAALPALFAELDAVVMPSMWYENSPNSILEAFAYRTPVIATRLGGMAELVQHEVNGLLFELGDSADLAGQLRRMIDEPGLLTRLTDGIGRVRTSQEELDELEQIYIAAVERQPVPRGRQPD